MSRVTIAALLLITVVGLTGVWTSLNRIYFVHFKDHGQMVISTLDWDETEGEHVHESYSGLLTVQEGIYYLNLGDRRLHVKEALGAAIEEDEEGGYILARFEFVTDRKVQLYCADPHYFAELVKTGKLEGRVTEQKKENDPFVVHITADVDDYSSLIDPDQFHQQFTPTLDFQRINPLDPERSID